MKIRLTIPPFLDKIASEINRKDIMTAGCSRQEIAAMQAVLMTKMSTGTEKMQPGMLGAMAYVIRAMDENIDSLTRARLDLVLFWIATVPFVTYGYFLLVAGGFCFWKKPFLVIWYLNGKFERDLLEHWVPIKKRLRKLVRDKNKHEVWEEYQPRVTA